MTVIWQCDYCGQRIFAPHYVTLSAQGKEPDPRGILESKYVEGSLGHFHTAPTTEGEPSCYDRVLNAMDLAISWGPTLENIKTATPQWVGAQRRRMRRDP